MAKTYNEIKTEIASGITGKTEAKSITKTAVGGAIADVLDFANGDKLKILVIGNSYSCDSFGYVPFILKNYGIEVEIGIWKIAGASLQNQVNDWSLDEHSVNSKFYYINTSTDNSWSSISSVTSAYKSAIYKSWNIVVLQQGSKESLDSNTYEPYARELVNKVLSACNQKITFGWNININRLGSDSVDDLETLKSREETILSNTKSCVEKEPIGIVFPYGTAIFQARSTELDSIGVGGHLWCSDTIHLQDGLPCYVAALANVQALFNKYYPMLSVINDTTRPTQDNITSWNVPEQNGSSVGITDVNCVVAQLCAIIANNNPYYAPSLRQWFSVNDLKQMMYKGYFKISTSSAAGGYFVSGSSTQKYFCFKPFVKKSNGSFAIKVSTPSTCRKISSNVSAENAIDESSALSEDEYSQTKVTVASEMTFNSDDIAGDNDYWGLTIQLTDSSLPSVVTADYLFENNLITITKL